MHYIHYYRPVDVYLVAKKHGFTGPSNDAAAFLLTRVGKMLNVVPPVGGDDLLSALKNYQNYSREQLLAIITSNSDQVNTHDIQGNTPLMYACQMPKIVGQYDNTIVQIVDLLLKMGAYIDAQNNIGVTPLMFATLKSNDQVVRLLISNGADVDLQSTAGKTAIMYAIDKLSVDTCKLMIAASNNINTIDKNGRTALIHAVLKNDSHVLKPLIKKGANLQIRDNLDNTALMYARDNRYKYIEAMLMTAGATE